MSRGSWVQIPEVALLFFFFFFFFSSQQYGIRTFEDNSKLHGHTNEHVQFEGAHQEINRSLLPCRHTDNDIYTSAQVSWACIHVSTNFTSNHHSVWLNQFRDWTFGYVAIPHLA